MSSKEDAYTMGAHGGLPASHRAAIMLTFTVTADTVAQLQAADGNDAEHIRILAEVLGLTEAHEPMIAALALSSVKEGKTSTLDEINTDLCSTMAQGFARSMGPSDPMDLLAGLISEMGAMARDDEQQAASSNAEGQTDDSGAGEAAESTENDVGQDPVSSSATVSDDSDSRHPGD